MKIDDVRSVIIGNLEAVDQGLALVDTLSPEQYSFKGSEFVQSSIGQHIRHILDVFNALLLRQEQSDEIDYDRRRRGAEVEVEPEVAKFELSTIKRILSEYLADLGRSTETLTRECDVKTEVTVDETHSVLLPSNVLRELVFTSSHAVHHFALISVIAKIQGIDLGANFGVAPATATYYRNEPADVVTQ